MTTDRGGPIAMDTRRRPPVPEPFAASRLLAVAATGPPRGPGRAQSVLRLPIPADPIMNPVIGTDAAAVPVNRFLFDSLTRPDPKTLEPRPDLATEWSARPDGLRVDLQARPERPVARRQALHRRRRQVHLRRHPGPQAELAAPIGHRLIKEVKVGRPVTR